MCCRMQCNGCIEDVDNGEDSGRESDSRIIYWERSTPKWISVSYEISLHTYTSKIPGFKKNKKGENKVTTGREVKKGEHGGICGDKIFIFRIISVKSIHLNLVCCEV